MSARLDIDPRHAAPTWDAGGDPRSARRLRLTLLLAAPLILWYFGWLLQPERIGNPALYAALITAEIFNLTQAVGFWWTTARQRVRAPLALLPGGRAAVDVFIPTYDEPVEIVEPTVAAAVRLRGAQVNVHLLDDGHRDELRDLAARHGAGYLRRDQRAGAKAGNVNAALERTTAPYVVVLDCDHVPDERFLERTVGHMADERVALVQTPQYYANARSGRIASAAWAQQALFFGTIARGKDAHGATFCCGTNMVLRRSALEAVGGFPEGSLTEDFELSIRLHQEGWRTAYLPEVLARGLAPEDMASYVSQQQRWARGCLSGLRTVARARGLSLRLRAQYGLSAMYFLTGWTVLVYMSMPVVRILTGEQPLAGTSADQFLVHFAPWFGGALLLVAIAGAGTYTFGAFSLAVASFWIHIQATVLVLLGRHGSFVVTPKEGERRRQLRPILVPLTAIAILTGAATWGLLDGEITPATMNNVAFAALHVAILTAGVWGALVPDAPAPAARGLDQRGPRTGEVRAAA